VRLTPSSRKPLAQISRELDVSEQTVRNWRKQTEIDEGKREGLTTDENRNSPDSGGRTRFSGRTGRS
jgi:transposase